VAPFDARTGTFVPSGALLWTSDRPAYGTAVVTSNDETYVYGCISARFLDADCYVARAAASDVTDESAYAYYTGGGHWSARVDDAWPTTSASESVDVAWVAEQNRWLLAYVPPLGNTIEVRSGLAPEGPWSAPIALATCDAPPDAFCDGVHLHPALAAMSGGAVLLSYAIDSLSADKDAQRAANPKAWWPRFVALSLPSLP
jgi:hypothetical protein